MKYLKKHFIGQVKNATIVIVSIGLGLMLISFWNEANEANTTIKYSYYGICFIVLWFFIKHFRSYLLKVNDDSIFIKQKKKLPVKILFNLSKLVCLVSFIGFVISFLYPNRITNITLVVTPIVFIISVCFFDILRKEIRMINSR